VHEFEPEDLILTIQRLSFGVPYQSKPKLSAFHSCLDIEEYCLAWLNFHSMTCSLV